MKRISFFLLCSAIGFLSGCAQDDLIRSEGPTLTAGNATAANTAMQIVDPWPVGVEDTDFEVPSDRGGDGEDGSGGTAPGSAPTTTTANP